MKRDRILKKVAKSLEDNGYATVVVRNMHTCVDVFATRLGRTIAAKAVHNIDSATRSEAESLSKVASFMGAEPVIIGSTSSNGDLGRSVVYKRFLVSCIAPDSLDLIEESRAHYMASKSIGVKARIDGIKLRRLRRMSGISAGLLAKRIGVSRETIYNYERLGCYASGRVVEKITGVLGSRIAEDTELAEVPRISHERKLERTGINAAEISSAPFDVVARSENTYEISYDANPRTMSKRAELFGALQGLLKSNYPFFISRGREGNIRGIPVLKHSSMKGIKSERELLETLAALS